MGTREKSCYTSIGCTSSKTLKQALRFARLHNTSQAPFAHVAYSDPSVGHLLVTPGFRLFSGCCGTRFARLYKENYTRANLQIASHNGLKTSGLALDFSTVPFRRWRRITFCNEVLNSFTAHNGNSKRKPALSKSQLKAVDVQESSEDMFEVRLRYIYTQQR